ncbi:MAG: tryptophan synthase subunit alpha [Candidatus Limnocylindrales bacterium]
MTATMTSAMGTAVVGTRDTAGSRRIGEAFTVAKRDGRIALVPYVVAGYPDDATSERVALAAIDNGADVLELGLPYSDPLADGATLQRASTAALEAGATLATSLKLVERIAAARPNVPLLVMGYVNQFIGLDGPGPIADRLASAGCSGAIVADLTPDEGEPVEIACRDAGLALVYLVAPTTPRDRATWIAEHSGGFLYCVSLVGVTGARTALSTTLTALVKPLVKASPIPVAVGFGISKPAHVKAIVRAGADGAVVGSALVDALGPDGTDVAALARAVARLRAATAS